MNSEPKILQNIEYQQHGNGQKMRGEKTRWEWLSQQPVIPLEARGDLL